MHKYIQLHTITTPFEAALQESRGGPEPYDGMVEAWWESIKAIQHSLTDPSAQEAWGVLAEDESALLTSKTRLCGSPKSTLYCRSGLDTAVSFNPRIQTRAK